MRGRGSVSCFVRSLALAAIRPALLPDSPFGAVDVTERWTPTGC